MSILYLQYQVSDVRSEPVPERPHSPPRPQPPVVDHGHQLYQFSPLDDCGLFRRTLSRGEMIDGSISVEHPAVALYVARTKVSLEVSKGRHWGSPMGWPWHRTDGRCISWWSAEKAGVVRMGDSSAVCHDHVERMLNRGELQRSTTKAVFALAALSCIGSPGELVFWAFWGLKSAERTAELVDEVINTHPPLISVPDSVVWASKTSALFAIEESRRPLLPTTVYPIQFISSNLHLFTEDPKPAQLAKRKRAAADSDAAQPVAKRTRTRTARCSAAKPQVPVSPQRKSARLRQNAEAAMVPPAEPANALAAVAETGPADAEANTNGDVDIVVDVEMVEETPAQAKAVAGPKKTRRATTKRTSRKSTSAGKRRAPRKSAATASPQHVVEEAPQEAASQPTPPSSGRIRIPPRGPSSSPASVPGLLVLPSTAALSPAATAVGTPAPLEGVTCVNTPNGVAKELPINLEKVDAKLTAPSKVPVRTSARIRQKAVTTRVEAA